MNLAGYEADISDDGLGEQLGRFGGWLCVHPSLSLSFLVFPRTNPLPTSTRADTIIPGYSNCTSHALTTDPTPRLSFVTYPDDKPCDEMYVDVTGGVAPYTVSILVGTTGTYANLTGVKEKTIRLKNTVAAGQSFTSSSFSPIPSFPSEEADPTRSFAVFVTDSTGNTSSVSTAKTSSLNLSGCSAAVLPSSSSSTPIGTIVGAAVGGVIAAALIALLAWWFLRRRRRRAHEDYLRAGGLPTTSEFRTADGSAPLVEPFEVPLAASAVGMGMAGAGGSGSRAGGGAGRMASGEEVREYEDHSPTSVGSGSYDKSIGGGNGGVGGRQYAMTAPSSPEHYRHAHLPHPPPPLLTHGQHAYPSPSSPYDPYLGSPHSPSSGSANPYASYESRAAPASEVGTTMPAHGSYDSHVHSLSSPVEPHPSSLALQHQQPQLPSPSRAQQLSQLPLPPRTAGGGEAPRGGTAEEGLANPDDFEFRLFDPNTGVAGGGGSVGGGGTGRYA